MRWVPNARIQSRRNRGMFPVEGREPTPWPGQGISRAERGLRLQAVNPPTPHRGLRSVGITMGVENDGWRVRV